MNKLINEYNFPAIEQVNTPKGRFYKTPQGKLYPSVSTVCGYQSAQHIKSWKQRVGEKEANRICNIATQRGTRIHALCEEYLTTGKATPDIFDEEVFNTLLPYLNEIDNIEAMEQPLYSDFLQVAGTVDLIATLNGVPSVIDWKTSKRIKTKKDIHSYFCQAFFYGQAFFEHTKIRINQLVIIMGIDDNPASIFIERAQDWREHALNIRNEYRKATSF